MSDSEIAPAKTASLLRHAGGQHGVGFAETFFDLVYVFAITQLSHHWLAHHDLMGAAQTTTLFLCVWWGWIFMVWATNWLDPERTAVRLMIFLVMAAGLVMSAAIPHAFGARAPVFVGTYIVMQLGRCLWVAWATRHRAGLSRNMLRASVWFLCAAPFWIMGAFAPDAARLMWWAAAIAIEYLAPGFLFFVPGMGRSTTQDFEVAGEHMAERCALFVIIALGEGILLTGATFAEKIWSGDAILACATALVGSIAMWWIYFDNGMLGGSAHIRDHADSGRVARNAYTYLHLPICAGIVLGAAADELLIAHPHEIADSLFTGTLVGGLVLFLAGTMFFKRATNGRPWLPLSHAVGLLMLGLLASWGLWASIDRLHMAAGSVVVLIIVGIWEWGSLHGGWVERGIGLVRTRP